MSTPEYERRILETIGEEGRTTYEIYREMYPHLRDTQPNEYRKLHHQLCRLAKYGILERRKVGPIYGHYTSEWRVVHV